MTENENLTPPPPPPPAAATPPPPAPPAPPAATAPPAPPAPPVEPPVETSGNGGKKLIIGGIAAALVLGGGYGAYAVYDKLDGGGAQPHDVMPASTQFYVRADLDPSASQKIAMFKLIRKVPDVAKEIGIKNDDQDIRELILNEALNACDDVDYDKDVKPWLGERIGVGGNLAEESFTIAVQVKDEKKSRDGIKKLFACSNENYGIAFLDGYAILSESQDTVDKSVKAVAKGTLGENEAFTKDFDDLGNQGVASAWADFEALAETPEAADALGADVTELKKAGTVAMTLRADGNALELAALGASEAVGATKDATSLSKLPDDTVVGMSIAGVGDQIDEAINAAIEGANEAFSGGGSSLTPDDFPTQEDFDAYKEFEDSSDSGGFGGDFDAQSFLDDIETQTGFNVREDLKTLFGDSLSLALGSTNLETIPSLSGPEDVSKLNVALALKSDKTKALDLVQRIASAAGDIGITLVAEPTDDGAVLATNAEAAAAIANPDGKLGDNEAFKKAIPDGDANSGGMFINIGGIMDKLLEADPPEDVRKGIEDAKALASFGASMSEVGDDRSLVRMRLAFN